MWNAAQVSRPGGWDTDRDGMPDAWESANGLDPKVDDHNGDADGDGYRNVEEYLEHAAQGGQANPTPPVTTPPVTTPPAGGCTAAYRTTNSWSGGFQGEVTVTAGGSPVTGWSVRWTLGGGQSIGQIWSGRLATSGAAVTVTNESYNGALAAGASTTFGFIATGTATTPALTCAVS